MLGGRLTWLESAWFFSFRRLARRSETRKTVPLFWGLMPHSFQPYSFQPSFFSETSRFPWDSGGFLERRIPGKNGEGTNRLLHTPKGQLNPTGFPADVHTPLPKRFFSTHIGVAQKIKRSEGQTAGVGTHVATSRSGLRHVGTPSCFLSHGRKPCARSAQFLRRMAPKAVLQGNQGRPTENDHSTTAFVLGLREQEGI